jgi:hypothetical protein
MSKGQLASLKKAGFSRRYRSTRKRNSRLKRLRVGTGVSRLAASPARYDFSK